MINRLPSESGCYPSSYALQDRRNCASEFQMPCHPRRSSTEPVAPALHRSDVDSGVPSLEHRLYPPLARYQTAYHHQASCMSCARPTCGVNRGRTPCHKQKSASIADVRPLRYVQRLPNPILLLTARSLCFGSRSNWRNTQCRVAN